MTTTTRPETRPLFPAPIGAYDGGGSTPETLLLYGYHRPFCDPDGNDDGEVPDQFHGHACRSSHGTLLDVMNEDGSCELVGLRLAQAYMHGRYPSPLDRRVHETWVQMTYGDSGEGDRGALYLRASEDRSLAAALVRMADAVEFRNDDFTVRAQ